MVRVGREAAPCASTHTPRRPTRVGGGAPDIGRVSVFSGSFQCARPPREGKLCWPPCRPVPPRARAWQPPAHPPGRFGGTAQRRAGRGGVLVTGRSCGGTGRPEPGGPLGLDGTVGSAWATARGSADKRCSALAPVPTSPAARSCPRPGPCERRSRSHTCANIRPPAGKTAPLCPAWHRCPSLAVSCGPGLAIVPAGPAPPPPSSWAGDSHSQRWRPCSCPGGWSGRGSSYGSAPGTSWTSSSGSAAWPGASEPAGRCARRWLSCAVLCVASWATRGASPALPCPVAPRPGRTDQGLPTRWYSLAGRGLPAGPLPTTTLRPRQTSTSGWMRGTDLKLGRLGRWGGPSAVFPLWSQGRGAGSRRGWPLLRVAPPAGL